MLAEIFLFWKSLFAIINFTLIMPQFTDLKSIHLRNNHFNCENVDNLPMQIIVDCVSSMVTGPMTLTTTLGTTTVLSPPTTNWSTCILISWSANNGTVTHASHLGDRTVSVVLIPAAIICLRSVIKLWATKSRRTF